MYLQFESNLPIYLSIYLPIYLSIHLSIYLSIHLLIYFSTCDNQPADQSTTYWLTSTTNQFKWPNIYIYIVQSLIDMLVCLYLYIILWFLNFPGVLLGVNYRSRLWHWHPCSLVAEFGGVLSAAEGSVYHRECSGAAKRAGWSHSDNHRQFVDWQTTINPIGYNKST